MGYDEFGFKDGEDFPYKVGDEFSGSPTQVSRFMRMVFSQQGQVEVDGNSVRITALPEPEKTKAVAKKAAPKAESKKAEPKAEAKVEAKVEPKAEAEEATAESKE